MAGCGYYTEDTHPADMDDRPVEAIAEELIRELTEGIDGSPIRAGVIGEIGTSAELHPNERKSLMAAAMAHRTFPTAIHVHTFPWAREGLEIADILIDAGVDPAKVVIDHLDVDIDTGYLAALLERGVTIEFDCFGKEYQIDASDEAFAPGPFARDVERVDVLVNLIEKGRADQLLIANDICFKTLLVAYGAGGTPMSSRTSCPCSEGGASMRARSAPCSSRTPLACTRSDPRHQRHLRAPAAIARTR